MVRVHCCDFLFMPALNTLVLRWQYLTNLEPKFGGVYCTDVKLVTCRACCCFIRSFHIWHVGQQDGHFCLCKDCSQELVARLADRKRALLVQNQGHE